MLEAMPVLRTMHPWGATLPADCLSFFAFSLYCTRFFASIYVPQYAHWLATAHPDGIYRSHNRALQQLQWKGPKGRWILKEPMHLLNLDRPIPFESYAQNRTLGGFILIDKLTNATVGAGIIHFSLRRAQNVHWQALDISRDTHASLKNQKPAVLWFTGLSGAGKSTIANLVEKKLVRMNRHTFLLDGDNVRHGLNKDLGFTQADRVENIRRVGEVRCV